MDIDISKLPYKHRFAAASMLMSKGRRLTDVMEFPLRALNEKQKQQVLQGLSFYDMALSLIKRNDGNFQTLLNWKCQALIELGQFEDARKWYEELVQIAIESEGSNCLGPTARFAQQQIDALSGKGNEPLPKIDELDIRVFDDPPFCAWAEKYCRLFQDQKFKLAHRCLSKELGSTMTVAKMKELWLGMLASSSEDVTITLQEYELAPASSAQRHVGWCYFSVTNDQISEAVSMDVYLTASNAYEVHNLQFGRP